MSVCIGDGRVLVAWACACAWLVAAAAECPAACVCAADDLLRVSCGAQHVKARDDGYVEITCEGGELNCTALPQLSVGRGAALQRLEVTQCALGGARLACALARVGARAARDLAVQQAPAGLSADNVRDLGAESLFLTFTPGALTEVPVEAFAALPRLRRVRLLSGTNLALRPRMFASVPPLSFLEISMSGIQQIPEDAFAGQGNLAILSLWGNSIQNISVDAFTGLDSLEELRLNSNPFSSLPVGVLAPTPRLRRLCLERNNLQELPEGVVSDLPLLEELKLQSDVELTLGPRALAHLPSLAALVLRWSRVPALPADLFLNSTALVNLTLSNNRISAIPEEVFGSLGSLQILDLSGNRIEELSPRALAGLAALVRLDLSGNRIRHLPDRLFGGLTRLAWVSASDNELASVAAGALGGAAALRTLLLARNRLGWGGADAEYNSPMASLVDLQTLDLSHNNISAMFVDWRIVLRQLVRLDLSYNTFQYLSLADVQFLGFTDENITTEVDLRHNRIRAVQPRGLYTTPSPNVRFLLDGNPFDCGCELFDFLQEVKRAGRYVAGDAACARPPALAGRALLPLPPEAVTCPVEAAAPCACLVRPALDRTECDCARPAALPDPADVGLRDMALRLRAVPRDLALPPFVRELNLSGLALREVPPVPPTVRLLDLTDNLLESVSEELLDGSARLRLAGNPLECSCRAAERLARLQRRAARVADYARVACGGARGRRVRGVDAAALCGAARAALAGALAAAAGALLAAAAALLYRYRLELQVLLYERGRCLRWLPREDPDADKRHDVFLSFAPEDERFVREELLPRLEARHSVLVRERDWEAGEAIPAQIRRSVERSRRTLFVMSRAFARSLWAGEELRAAHAAATRDRRRRAVVLLLDLAEKQLDEETRELLSLATVIRVGGRMCWGRLAYALPKKDLYAPAAVARGAAAQAVDPYKGAGLNVVIDDQGKLVNKGYVKDA